MQKLLNIALGAAIAALLVIPPALSDARIAEPIRILPATTPSLSVRTSELAMPDLDRPLANLLKLVRSVTNRIV